MQMPLLRLKLMQLKEATNDSIRGAKRLRNSRLRNQAVNWADLKCFSAEFRVDDEGEEYYAVKIDEADPGVAADGFAHYVREALAKRGFKGVAVETEW